MDSILHHLWNGEIDPLLQAIPTGAEYIKAEKIASDEVDWWHEKLSREDFNRLEKYRDMIRETNDFYHEEHFKYGFRLAIQLFIDALTNPLPIKTS